MKQRNYNIDIFRALASILIVIYHSWVLTGCVQLPGRFINTIVSLGGEIGVTAFFALSGYGIYCSLKRQDEETGISFQAYIKKRCIRIMPHYYICLFFALIFTNGAYYLTKEHLADIVTHMLFVHNLFPSYFGEINGVLWTMGVMVQFYLIAIPLYKLVKKRGTIAFLGSIAFTIAMKAFVYSKVLVFFQMQDTQTFFAGRQLFTALDNFVIGMYVAYLLTEKEISLKKRQGWIVLIFSIMLLYAVCELGKKYGIHTVNLSGYVWHTLLAITIGGIMFGISYVKIDVIKPVYQAFLWVAKYEFGIYLWHLLLIRNLIEKSQIVNNLMQRNQHMIIYVLFLGLSVLTGFLMTIMTDNIGIKLHYGNNKSCSARR